MKIFIIAVFIMLGLALLPDNTEGRTRFPVMEQSSRIGPDSRSRPPVRGRRPLQVSRRRLALHAPGLDFGLNLGTSNSLTDIGGTRVKPLPSFLDAQWRATGFNAGLFARYRINHIISINTALNYGRIGGADSLSHPATARYNRDFYFKNNIFEFVITGQVFPPYQLNVLPLRYYGFLGISGFFHNPDLTTGNPALYEPDHIRKFQPAIPMGVGFYYTFETNWRIGYEIGWRKTFFDFLDGFTRPASKANDSFFFGQVRVSYFIRQRGSIFRL